MSSGGVVLGRAYSAPRCHRKVGALYSYKCFTKLLKNRALLQGYGFCVNVIGNTRLWMRLGYPTYCFGCGSSKSGLTAEISNSSLIQLIKIELVLFGNFSSIHISYPSGFHRFHNCIHHTIPRLSEVQLRAGLPSAYIITLTHHHPAQALFQPQEANQKDFASLERILIFAPKKKMK